MTVNKFLKGTIAGAVLFFLLGYLLYGVLLADFMSENYNSCMNVADDEMKLWAIFLGNIFYAALFTLILGWANVTSVMDGAKKSALAGFCLSLSFTMMYYSMTTMYNSTSSMVVDVLLGTFQAMVVGLVIAWAMNMGEKAPE